eukprot:754256-Hanusia_phi.AAC.3
MAIVRPDPFDQATELRYGDFILLSCNFLEDNVGFLCEQGCVQKRPDSPMKTSSRELVFEICTAREERILVEWESLNKNRALSEDLSRLEHLQMQMQMEKKANESQAEHMTGKPVHYGDTIQLRQLKSQAFLGVDISQAPRDEPTAKKIVLHDRPGKPVGFKVLPRFRYLVEGHTVCYGDQITLESISFPREFLHASNSSCYPSDVGMVYEVTLSVRQETVWKVEPFLSVSSQSKTLVKVGDVVRLYHPFHQAYIAATGSDNTVYLQSGQTSLSSTMWVVADKNPLIGGLVKLHHSYSLMHLVTKRYLCVTMEKLQPALKINSVHDNYNDGQDDDASSLFSAVKLSAVHCHGVFFSFEPYDDDHENLHLQWSGRIRLMHTNTRDYLHCMNSHQLSDPLRPFEDSDLPQIARLKVLGMNLPGLDKDRMTEDLSKLPERVVVASPALFREDSFDVEQVPEEQIRSVDVVLGILPTLEHYLEKLNTSQSVEFSEDVVLEILDRLSELRMYVYDIQVRDRTKIAALNDKELTHMIPLEYCQNFMHDLSVPHLLFAIIRQTCRIWLKQLQSNIESQTNVKSDRSHKRVDDVNKPGLYQLIKPTNLLNLPKNRSAKLVLQMCYSVLWHIVHKHKKNSIEIANFLHEMQDHLVLDIGAERVLLEVLEGNEKLLLSWAGDATRDDHIRFHLQALATEGKNPMHIRFLSAFTALADRGISRHQDIVLESIVDEVDDILLRVRLDCQVVQLFDARHEVSENPSSWRDLGDLVADVARPGKRGLQSRRMLEYWIECFALLANLCKPDSLGRRQFIIEKVQKFLPLEVCISCLQDERLSEHLRRHVCEFVRFCYVEGDEFKTVTRLTGISIWKDLDKYQNFHFLNRADDVKKPGSEQQDSARNPDPPKDLYDLRTIIKEYFAQSSCQFYPGERPFANELKLSMLKLCKQLLVFGFIAEEELKPVIKETMELLDFSSLRFGPAETNFHLERNRMRSGSLVKLDNKGESEKHALPLSDQTLSTAIKHLRPICKFVTPLEISRICPAFQVRVFEPGTTIVEVNEAASEMYVIQTGTAFVIETREGVEVVVENLLPGQQFGRESLVGEMKTWPWKVRCSQRVIALKLSADDFTEFVDYCNKAGKLQLTDELQIILETKREACSLLDAIYDLSLSVRTTKMLQEYRFDLNVSKKEYVLGMLVENSGQMLNKFPSKSVANQKTVPDLISLSFPCLPQLSVRLKPIFTIYKDVFRIDRVVLVSSFLQYVVATVIVILLSIRIQQVRATGWRQPLARYASHPGLSNGYAAIIINMIMTISWAVSLMANCFAVYSFHKVVILNSLSKRHHLLLQTGFLVQSCYLLYFLINTLVCFCFALVDNSANNEVYGIWSQLLWICFLTPALCLSLYLVTSLRAYMEFPSLFIQQESLDEKGLRKKPTAPRREFLKILEFMNLDEDGWLSSCLADLIIFPYEPLVVDAFHLLVRTHRNQYFLHRSLSNTLILVEDDSDALNRSADRLTLTFLKIANDIQSFTVERMHYISSKGSKDIDKRIRAISSVEPKLTKLLEMIDDDKPLMQRKLFQRKCVHNVLLRLLRCLPADFQETTGPLCFQCLAALCNDSLQIQTELSQHLGIYRSFLDSIPRSVVMLLSAIYCDNVDLCYTVDESLVSQVVELMQEEVDICYINFLHVIIVPKHQVLRRNQNLVTKYLEMNNVQLPLFQGASGRRMRADILDDSNGSQAILRCYLASVRLMTLCMKEWNHENKARFRRTGSPLAISLEDVMYDLRDDRLPDKIKEALLEFLSEAYIRVDMVNAHLRLQLELCDIFEHLARTLELLPCTPQGERLALLSESERRLLTVGYMDSALAFFSSLPASDLLQKDNIRVKVGGHLLEALLDLLASDRKVLQAHEELRMLDVMGVLVANLRSSFSRFNFLQSKFQEVFGSSAAMIRLKDPIDSHSGGLAEDKEDKRVEENFVAARRKEIEAGLEEEEEERLGQKLDIAGGVVVFANEFLRSMESCEQDESETLKNAFLESKMKGDAGERNISFQHMQSLIGMLSNSSNLSYELTEKALKVVKDLIVIQQKQSNANCTAESERKRVWLKHGIAKMVIELMSSAQKEDRFVLECLNISNFMLETGKGPCQSAFKQLLKQDEKNALFQNLRDRLVRAERALPTLQNSFNKYCSELSQQSSNRGFLLTLEGLEEIMKDDRANDVFYGSHALLILRFLQLLCEGHNREMQEYMRFQGKKSIDLVSSCAEFLAACSRHMHPCSIAYAIQCVDTLVEFVQNPCYKNQRALVDTQLPHVLNQFLQLLPTCNVEFLDVSRYEKDVDALKNKSVTLLLSLLERVDDPFIPARILKALEIDKLLAQINTLRELYLGGDNAKFSQYEEDKVAVEEISEHGAFQVACSLFMLVVMLQYFDKEDEHDLSSKLNQEHIKDFVRLQANCGFLEISRDGKLERVFFQIPAICRHLSREAKRDVLRDLSRGNHQDRMLELVESSLLRYDEMVYMYELHKSVLYEAFHRISRHQDVAFFVNALLINFLILFGFKYKDKNYVTLESMANIILPSPFFGLIFIFSALQCVLCLLRLARYLIESGFFRVKKIFLSQPDYYQVYTELYGGPKYFVIFSKILLSDKSLLLLLFYLVMNVLALILGSQNNLFLFFLISHLIDMFNLSRALGNVIRAVSSRANTLLQTAALAFVMMFIYSAIGFVLFPEYFAFEAAEVRNGDEMSYNVNSARCDSIWKCFLIVVDMGLRKGDVGGALEDIQWRSLVPGSTAEQCSSPPGLEYMGCLGIGGIDMGPYIILRIAYTTTFFILVNTILLNIIFGIIIDTFGELRKQNQDMEEDLNLRCFICGLERYRFEINSRDGQGFEQHIRRDHNIWAFLYFIVYLSQKSIDEHTGFESYVFKKLNDVDEDGRVVRKHIPDITWIPSKEAMVLKSRAEQEDEHALAARLVKLDKEIKSLASSTQAHLQALLFMAESSGEFEDDANDGEDEDEDEDEGGYDEEDGEEDGEFEEEREFSESRVSSTLSELDGDDEEVEEDGGRVREEDFLIPGMF